MAFCGFYSEKYKDHFKPGKYVCVKCGHDLFSSASKYKHSTPWPAFNETMLPDSLSKKIESPGALKVSCGKCAYPLGHEFLNEVKMGKSRF